MILAERKSKCKCFLLLLQFRRAAHSARSASKGGDAYCGGGTWWSFLCNI